MPPRKIKTEPVVNTTPVKKPTSVSPVTPAVAVKKDMLIPVLVGAIIVAAFAVGYLYGQNSLYSKMNLQPGTGTGTQAAQPQDPTGEAAPTITKDQIKALASDKKNIVFGNPNSKVIFAEFSDPSCPYCHIAGGKNGELNAQVGDRFKLVSDGGTYVAPVPEMKKLVDQNKAAFVWVYSPGHGNGELATEVLYCAHEQGKFWPVHDLLMSNAGYTLLNETVKNDKTKLSQMSDFVKAVVDTGKLQSCVESGKFADRVASDTALSREYGVQGTPSFFINDKNYGGAYNYNDMKSTVEAAL